jgi:hypothetical protein
MNRQFPALRGLAILLVVLNHSITLALLALRKYGYSPAPALERQILVALKQFGLIAVPAFLFLSGCFIVYAVQGKPWRAAYKVVLNGLKHVIWPYVIWSFVFYVMVFFLEGERYSPLGYLKNLAVGYPFDFVPLLVFFYFLAPILVRAGRGHPWMLLVGIGAYQLFVANVLKPGALGFAFPQWAWYLTLPALRVSLALWGIFFPLGVVYMLHGRSLTPWLHKLWPLLALAAVVLFVLAVGQELSRLSAPLADLLCPVAAILLFPVIQRKGIPWADWLEQLGKKAYALYLMNLIVLNLALAGLHALAPWAFAQLTLLALGLFVITLSLPRLVIAAVDRLPNPSAHRYVFG